MDQLPLHVVGPFPAPIISLEYCSCLSNTLFTGEYLAHIKRYVQGVSMSLSELLRRYRSMIACFTVSSLCTRSKSLLQSSNAPGDSHISIWLSILCFGASLMLPKIKQQRGHTKSFYLEVISRRMGVDDVSFSIKIAEYLFLLYSKKESPNAYYIFVCCASSKTRLYEKRNSEPSLQFQSRDISYFAFQDLSFRPYSKSKAYDLHAFVWAAQKDAEGAEMVGTFCKRTRYLLLICQKLECDVVRCLCLRFSLYTHDQNKRHLMGFSELLIAIWYKNQDMSQFMRRNHLIYSLSKILGVTTAAFDFCAGSKPKNHARHAFETTSQIYFLRMLALPFVIMLLAMKLNQK